MVRYSILDQSCHQMAYIIFHLQGSRVDLKIQQLNPSFMCGNVCEHGCLNMCLSLKQPWQYCSCLTCSQFIKMKRGYLGDSIKTKMTQAPV